MSVFSDQSLASPSKRDETLLKVITDNLPIGIAYVDPNKTYRFANNRFASAYGLPTDGIIGMRADEFICNDAMEVGDPFFEAAYKGTAVDFLHPARHADGREMIVRTFLRPEFSDSGEVLGFFVCSFNVTREKKAEANLVQAQKMDAVGQMASGIAHDFNNLLAVVIGNMEALREKVSDTAVREEYVDPTLHAVEQGVQLTRQLLVVAKRQPLCPETLDLPRCMEKFLPLLGSSIKSGIEITADCPDDLPPVFLDKVQFEVALLNLCLNARDAMPDGGELKISFEYPSRAAGADFVRLTVADTGTGIPADVCAQIFEPFFTTKGSDEGTGLGLSMVWGFVEQSAARIDVESEPGKGTRFLLDLPVSTAEGLDTRFARVPGGKEELCPGLILLVDDNHSLRKSIRKDLTARGYRVIEAESAEEALPLIDAIDGLQTLVTDIMMTGQTGLELAEAATQIRPDLKVVLMTAGDIADCAKSNPAGFPILKKPFQTETLIAEIERVNAKETRLAGA